MAATEEMQKIALKHKPHAVCLVPEKREERTTEGGLDVLRDEKNLRAFIKPLNEAGCRVSLFIAAVPAQVDAAKRVGATVVELHTGAYCDYFYEAKHAKCDAEFENLKKVTLELDIIKNVIFLGDINENQKKYLFKNTNLMVMPTIDESKKNSIEGFGIAYLEAAYYGIPSIASNVGGTPEAVIHNETGIIISDMSELYTSVKDLLANSLKLNELGKKAKLRAENDFTWEAIGNKYLQLMQNLE